MQSRQLGGICARLPLFCYISRLGLPWFASILSDFAHFGRVMDTYMDTTTIAPQEPGALVEKTPQGDLKHPSLSNSELTSSSSYLYDTSEVMVQVKERFGCNFMRGRRGVDSRHLRGRSTKWQTGKFSYPDHICNS
jgi:hypothetical protein